MGSDRGSALNLHKKPPEPQGKKRKFPKLGKFKLKIGLKRIIVGGTLLTAFGLYTAGNTFSVGPDEAVYAFNSVRFGDQVSVYRGTGWKPFFSNHSIHFPWPLGGGDAPAGWPIGGHAVVPLTGDYDDLILKTPMYSTAVDVRFRATAGFEEEFVRVYGPAGLSGTSTDLEQIVEGGDYSLSGIVEAVHADGSPVDEVERAILRDIRNAMETVLRGKSVEEIERLKDDEYFIETLIHDIETAHPLIDIEILEINRVTRNDDVITVTTKDGFPIDMQIYLSGISSRSSYEVDIEEVQNVIGDYYLMDLRTGELSPEIYDKLVVALGVDSQVTESDNEYDWLYNRGLTEDLEIPYYRSTSASPELVVVLGNAQDQFYRTSFNLGSLALLRDAALERWNFGNLDGAIELLEGVVEYSHRVPLTDDAELVVADSMYSLGRLYEEIMWAAADDDNQEVAMFFRREAVTSYVEYMKFTDDNSVPHPLRLQVGQYVNITYPHMLDWGGVEVTDDDDDVWTVPIEGVPPETPTPTPTTTP